MDHLRSIKLHQPVPPLKHVQRQALIQKLNEGLAAGHAITLVSAPAGFGKTCCISEWLAELALPVAWLSLDADDNDPGRFFSYLAEAFIAVNAASGRPAFPHFAEVARVLSAGQLPPQEAIVAALTADIVDFPDRFVLVLDDFHNIQDRFILKVFEKLLSSLFQPQSMHLVLLTREDPALPLARLRANNQLNELRAMDLRFSAQEAGDFLNEVLGLGLAEQDIASLTDRTEGWVAGLQLAGLSVRGRADPSNFIRGLSGSHRFILTYLTEEVLSRQTESVQQFLLETAILDRLSGDLCNAVTGRADSAVLLEQLCSANLFLIPLDDNGRWYRYHHLFADLLRSRLSETKTAELHRAASRWFAQAAAHSAGAQSAGPQSAGAQHAGAVGDRALLAGEAIRHAMTAADYATAVALIENHATEIIDQWYARTIQDWMQALPPEWSAHSPRTNLAFVRMHLIRADFAQALPYLERLQALFSSPSADVPISPATRAEWLALQASMLSAQGKPAEALELVNQAQRLAPESDANALSQVYLALAGAYQQLDDPDQAEAAYRKLIQIGQAAGNLIAELLGITALGLMLIERGRLRDSFVLTTLGAEHVERSGRLPPICGGLYGELGSIYFHWHQLEQADHYFQRAAQVSTWGSYSDAGIYYAVMQSRLSLIRGDLAASAREIDSAVSAMRADAPVVVREEVLEQQVRVFLAQGDLTTAEQILWKASANNPGRDALPDLAAGQRITYPQGVLYNSALRVLLTRVRVQPKPATDLVESGIARAGQLMAALRQRQYVPLMLETLLLRAQLHAALGNAHDSLSDLTAALELAEPEGYLSLFVIEGQPVRVALTDLRECRPPGTARAAFIARILAAFPNGQALPASSGSRLETGDMLAAKELPGGLPEALTERELEVLHLITEGHSYAAMAAALVVSINTIRTHVKSIYGKLDVNNRVAAIEASRRMNLL